MAGTGSACIWEPGLRPTLGIGALLLLACPAPVLAQDGAPAGPPVAFPQVTAIPLPLQSTSGRFSSLNPPNQVYCPVDKVIGRVVSPRLLSVKVNERLCGVAEAPFLLLNVELATPTDAEQMITGRRVVIMGRFKTAHEYRSARFNAEFLIAEKAQLVAGDPRAAPTPPFTSYMLCQAPELDALASKLGRELCVQSTMLANFAATGGALETAVRAASNASADDTVPDDLDTISCRADPGVSDRHLPAVSCARGSYWAWYKKKWSNPLLPTPAPP